MFRSVTITLLTEQCECLFDLIQKGKVVQIDESKFEKRKYSGHHVEGQWVFGRIEEERRKSPRRGLLESCHSRCDPLDGKGPGTNATCAADVFWE